MNVNNSTEILFLIFKLNTTKNVSTYTHYYHNYMYHWQRPSSKENVKVKLIFDEIKGHTYKDIYVYIVAFIFFANGSR